VNSWAKPLNEEIKRGHPFMFSDTAIECLLVLREELARAVLEDGLRRSQDFA
jgi:hypothetical protein